MVEIREDWMRFQAPDITVETGAGLQEQKLLGSGAEDEKIRGAEERL